MAHIENPVLDECGCFQTAVVSKTAPAFKGKTFHAGKISETSLKKLKGKWVILFFYPADFTFVCPTELGDVADNYAELQKLGAEVISVSTDTEWCHKVWADISPVIKKVKYPMLADPTGEVCRAYGVYIEEEGLAARGRFIIDPDGVLKSAEITDGPLGRNIDETLRQLKALQFMRKNPGQACPARWTPGAATLTPGAKLAGKI
jgi:peroxiredoxin (alkyl hydroperoxide reductase subunit C)